MVQSRIIQKIINGKLYHYDRFLDAIGESKPCLTMPYNRTQVQTPVDLSVEISTRCNLNCLNCFSNSGPHTKGADIDLSQIYNIVLPLSQDLIRISLTGGEPLLHPDIDEILELPEKIPNCGFVLNTNGFFGEELDKKICLMGWLIAFSLHGHERSHNAYTHSSGFRRVSGRIAKMAQHGIVHMYCVLHDMLEFADIDWLFKFRDEVGVKFLRFILPRPFGRHKPLTNQRLITYIIDRLDNRSGLKINESLTQFLSVKGYARKCN